MAEVIYKSDVINNVDEAISAALESWGSTKKRIQVAAVAVVIHAAKCGDRDKAETLVNGLKGINQTGLVEWFTKYGGFIINEEGSGFSGWQGEEFIRANLEAGKKTMWWTLKPQQAYKGFDLDAALIALKERADKAKKLAMEDPEKAEVIHIEDAKYAALEKLVSGLEEAA